MRYKLPLREDGLFFSTGSAVLQPFVCLLETADAVRDALGDRQVWIVGSSTYAREQLAALFTHLRSVARDVTDTHLTFEARDREELQALFERLAGEPDGHVVLLAEDEYKNAFNQICGITPALLPVLLPTGMLVPALPGGTLDNGALLLQEEAALKFLYGKTATLWGKGKKCLGRIFRLLTPIFESMTIAGVVHETLKGLVLGGRGLPVYTPEAAGTLDSEILITTQDVLKRNMHAFTTMPLCTPVAMLRTDDYYFSCNPTVSIFVFYSFYKIKSIISYIKDQIAEKNNIYILKNGYFIANKNYMAEKHSYENGFRKTYGKPNAFDNNVYILGPSHVEAQHVPFEKVYCSILQNKFNQNSEKLGKIYAVHNLGLSGVHTENCLLSLMDRHIIPGDIVILHTHRYGTEDFECAIAMHKLCIDNDAHFLFFGHVKVEEFETLHEDDLQHIYHSCWRLFTSVKKDIKKKTFLADLQKHGVRAFDLLNCLEGAGQALFSDPAHLLESGHKLVADYIYDKITARQTYDISQTYAKCVLRNQEFVRSATLSCEENAQWLNAVPRIRKQANEIIGSIVMNCNPFTLGHKHIIAESLNKADKLYIFVVQEDRSYFSFEERYAMVCDGVKEFGPRVCVVPSGKLILSSTTFPEYFCKDTVSYEPDTHTDILIFASTIAPALGIQVRLFGDEPFCTVTAAYHKQLEQLLPICGILPVRIPRLESGGTAISASSVRRILEKRKFSELARLVPPTSMPYLLKKALPDTGDATRQRAV